MRHKYSEAEKHIIRTLEKHTSINKLHTVKYDNSTYFITSVDKPTCRDGEPKTDIYILITNKNCGGKKEIKISVKLNNADFLENKINSTRAESILGANWSYVIQSSTLNIKDQFESSNLIYKKKQGRTEEGSITLGWKFELLNKPGGRLSGKLNVDVAEVYKGSLLNKSKRNSYVKGKMVENSGVAEYLLFIDSPESIRTAQDVFDKIIPIDKYAIDNPSVYFACKALNYRTSQSPPKWDGNRPLGVYVDWNTTKNKLHASIVFDSPLIMKGNSVAKKLAECLRQLNVKNTNELNDSNIADPHIYN